jgi:penicillin-binding protein 2
VFFYTLADRLGITRMAKYATEFGLGQKTGIDLPQEASGLMPSEEWKIRNYRQKWYAGENMSVGIGQGAVVATPMQMTRALSAIASGGLMVTPHLTFTGDVQPNPNLVQASVQPSRVSIPIDPKNWEVITDAMAEVPGPLGTANSAHLQGIDFAGKTGSAQTISNTLKAKLANGKQDFKDNAWFVGVTPRRSPEFVVGVLFEGGEHGQFAARLAAQVVKSYVEKQRRTPTKVASAPRKVEIGAVWSTTDHEGRQEDFKAGHFTVDLPKQRLPLAVAAPGLIH